MAVDMFLELEGIKGESEDDKKKEACHVLAWSWGLTQSATTHHGTGGGSGKVNVHDISITKHVDKATATLIQFCCKGTHVKKGKLTVRKSGDKPLEYIKVELEDIIVASVSSGGSNGSEILTEHVVLNFRKFKYQYYPQLKDGSGGPAVEFGWDIAANKPE